MHTSFCFSDEAILAEKLQNMVLYAPPPTDATQSDGDNGKKRKAAPGSLLQRKVYRLDSGE